MATPTKTFAMPTTPTPLHHVLLQFLALSAPVAYTGVTAVYSNLALTPILAHAPTPAVMARQWLTLYQTGPVWAFSLTQVGAVANLALAYLSPAASLQRWLYLGAAAMAWVIMPLTFVWFEPGINGALKWKVGCVLKKEVEEGRGEKGEVGEGGRYKGMPEGRGWLRPSSVRHSATAASRQWAERTEVRELVVGWGRRNQLRWVMGLVASVLAGWATLGM